MLEILAQVVKNEDIHILKEAALELARNCNGSARDTLFLLEQLLFSKEGEDITLEDVKLLLEDYSDVAFNLIEALKNQDVENVLVQINSYFEEGGELRPLLFDMLRLLRAALITKTCYDYKKILNPSEKQIRLFTMLAREWKASHLIAMIEQIFKSFQYLDLGIDNRTLAELIFLSGTSYCQDS